MNLTNPLANFIKICNSPVAMRSKLAKVHRVTQRNKATRNHPARVTSERKATNFELLRDSVLVRGHVKIRTAFQIGCADGNYAGARGNSLQFIARSAQAAETFFLNVAEVLPQIAEAAGLMLLTPKSKTKEKITA
jgi:hypothetical protein